MNSVLRLLRRSFDRFPAQDMASLERRVPGRSPRSLYRDLSRLGYLSSFTHKGSYYTLLGIPEFDEWGLWFYRDVGFSRAGTLKETVVELVQAGPDGYTHAELQGLLRVRVHNTLLSLVREERIGRERYAGVHLYVSASPERAADQLRHRQEADRALAEITWMPTTEETVEVLAEALREAPEIPLPALVARRLSARGSRVEAHQVRRVYDLHGLEPGKKTPPPS